MYELTEREHEFCKKHKVTNEMYIELRELANFHTQGITEDIMKIFDNWVWQKNSAGEYNYDRFMKHSGMTAQQILDTIAFGWA